MGKSQHNCQCSWKKGGGFAAGHDSHSIPATKACMYNDSWKTSSITSWCQEPPASVVVRWCDVWSFPLHSTHISANDGTMIGMIGKVAQFFMSHMQIWFTDPPPMPPGNLATLCITLITMHAASSSFHTKTTHLLSTKFIPYMAKNIYDISNPTPKQFLPPFSSTSFLFGWGTHLGTRPKMESGSIPCCCCTTEM